MLKIEILLYQSMKSFTVFLANDHMTVQHKK